MLSYQHSYHAGCFADVMKHSILARLLNYMVQKDKPLLYLDTHAGRGSYDLLNPHALKTKEAQGGIQPLWKARAELPSLFLPYINAIEQLNPNNLLRYYPGSSALAVQLLRPEDRLVFCELHPQEFTFLQELSHQKRRVLCKKENGFTVLNTLLPPTERRGLYFIDPSYEVKTEYQDVVQVLKTAYKRCPTILYALWYPLINHTLPPQFLKNLEAIDAKNALRLEFYLTKKNNTGMTGSGLWIINPPYTLAEEGNKLLQALTQIIPASYLVS